LGAVAALVGLLLGVAARPVLAADAKLTMTVTQRWQLAATQGLWTPYLVTVHEEGGAAFTGDVYLVPNNSRTPPNAFPSYRAPITVAKGGKLSTTFYVIDGPDGYNAELRDPSGRVVARAQPSGSPGSRTAFGILSDLPQAEQKISAPLRALSQLDTALVRFGSAQDFPTTAAYLSGLSGLIIDQFDSGALSQAQVQALKDFVGLGGSLVLGEVGASILRLLLSAVLLAVPTLAMGATLPAVVTAVVNGGAEERRSVGWLYGANTLGAVCGTLLATFVLIELWGIRQTLWAAAVVNVGVGLLARTLSRTWPGEQTQPKAEARAKAPGSARGQRVLVGAAAVVGLVFFLMEIVWYRLLGPILGGSTFTFGLILALALLGIIAVEQQVGPADVAGEERVAAE